MAARGSLWRDGAFLRLWSAQTVSELGDNITQLALPLTAILVLHSTAFEVAALRGIAVVPFLLFSLPAGVWIDRLRRRPLMIAADIGRALALASIPIAYWTGSTSLVHLYAVAFVVGALAVVFDVSYLSFLPALIPGTRLAEGNSKLLTTQSGAQLVGPGLGGALVGLVTAPVAIVADAASFGLSAALIGAIRRDEGGPAPAASRRRLLEELLEGVRYVSRQPILRTLTVWTGAWNLFSSGLFAVALVYLVRGLHLDATTVGWIFAASNVGAVLGAGFNTRIVARFGLGPTMAFSGVLSSIAFFGFPLAPQGFPEPVLVAGGVLGTGLGMLFNVNQLTLRQAITPRRLMGRMNSVVRFMYWGTIPAGSVLGGGLAAGIGLRATLLVEAAGATLVTVPIALSRLRKLERLPKPLPADA